MEWKHFWICTSCIQLNRQTKTFRKKECNVKIKSNEIRGRFEEEGTDGQRDRKMKRKGEEKKRVHWVLPFLTWCPLQHREHLSFGTGEGDARLATTLLAQYRCVAEELAGPFLSSHRCLRLLLGLFLSNSFCLNSKRPAGKKMSKCSTCLLLD